MNWNKYPDTKPPLHTYVLVCFSNQDIGICIAYLEQSTAGELYLCLPTRDHSCFTPTHWMHLPELPEMDI